MSDDERKPRFQIHTGGLILLIIILLILFKVDIKSKIQSPQLKANITYVETQVKNLWEKYIVNPLKIKAGEVFVETTTKALKDVQDNVTQNVLKTNTPNTTN